MTTPSYAGSLVSLTKRLKLSPPNATTQCQTRGVQHAPLSGAVQQRRHEGTQRITNTASQPNQNPPSRPIDPQTASLELTKLRLPRAVQATYLDPLRHKPTHGIKTCELQLRSYSLRNLEVFADFAMRAAYYLKLPAKGPRPLPRITERWTVPRSNFVHKKSQENFERVTVRREIEVFDGHPEAVAVWLGFLKKRQYYGVGMKANVWEYGGVEVGRDLDGEAGGIAARLGKRLELVGGRRSLMNKEERVRGMVESEPFKARWGAYGAMGGAEGAPSAGKRIETRKVE